MADAGSKVQNLINENSVVVFSKSWCPHCSATKKALNNAGADYKVLDLDLVDDGSEIQDALEDISGQRTVPNVYIAKKHIGGNSDLQRLASAGKLEDLLRNASALKA